MLFVGDDWAEDRHDVEIVDDTGQVLARRRFPESLDGFTRLHALIGEHMPAEWTVKGATSRSCMSRRLGDLV